MVKKKRGIASFLNDSLEPAGFSLNSAAAEKIDAQVSKYAREGWFKDESDGVKMAQLMALKAAFVGHEKGASEVNGEHVEEMFRRIACFFPFCAPTTLLRNDTVTSVVLKPSEGVDYRKFRIEAPKAFAKHGILDVKDLSLQSVTGLASKLNVDSKAADLMIRQAKLVAGTGKIVTLERGPWKSPSSRSLFSAASADARGWGGATGRPPPIPNIPKSRPSPARITPFRQAPRPRPPPARVVPSRQIPRTVVRPVRPTPKPRPRPAPPIARRPNVQPREIKRPTPRPPIAVGGGGRPPQPMRKPHTENRPVKKPRSRTQNSEPTPGGQQRYPGRYPRTLTPTQLKALTAFSPERADRKLSELTQSGLLKSVPPAQFGLLQRIANVESSGKINAVQVKDAGILSFGFMQLTVRYGEVQTLIAQHPDAFKRHDIQLAKGRYHFGSKMILGAPRPDDLRSKVWVDRFLQAGQDPEIIGAEARFALAKLENLRKQLPADLKAAWPASGLEREKADALLLESWNNRPASAKEALSRLEKAVKEGGARGRPFVDTMVRAVQDSYRAAHQEEIGQVIVRGILEKP